MKNLVTGFAVALVALYVAGVIVLISFDVGVDDKIWLRIVYAGGGIEAIAFAAAGYLFGKEVHREQADKAEDRAAKAETAASDGKTLAAAVLAKAGNPPSSLVGQGATTAWQNEFADLVPIARRIIS